MTPERKSDTELAGLPAWLYPLGFWVAVALLALGALFPNLAAGAVAWVGLVPVLAAVWVAVAAWNRDRRLSVAALSALGGLAVVYMVKSLI
ncbi:hypothetical protein Dgeo_0616 [Deinococcus geothermalis DSM 11300]|uniref:Uncharacterized protein n=1 Tax=Deinococcus geothermalis (strain DSM 11300 / CIP 105573 / AG-3a) TaxID=319795 RepID=Q1J0R6_DEIGD|nr:hypothetical protein [Deinococcus geothermalis]ABF44918.1 hypothetical protein Dgeo_0616 [Deinococcus geothermalis DSM 11300]